jgi:hypothetical protein
MEDSMRRLIALPLLLSLPLLMPVHRLSAASGIRIESVTHGIRMTLAVPSRTYPRDALIRVSLTLTNVSHGTRYIGSGLQEPEAYVLDSSGAEVYSPHDPLGDQTLLEQKGPGPRSFALLAGHAWRKTQYVVLRGEYIGFEAILGRPGHGNEISIRSGEAVVRLTEEPKPSVAITSSPTLHAVVNPVVPAQGPLHYLSETSWAVGDNARLTGTGWEITRSTTIQSQIPASSLTGAICKWHAIASWLNHPVVEITYDGAAS